MIAAPLIGVCSSVPTKQLTPERLAARRSANREWMKRDRQANPEKYRTRDKERPQTAESCANAKARKARYRETHRTELRDAGREYAKATSARRRNDPARRAYMQRYSREWNLRKRYGITAAQYDSLLAQQNGVCAVCKCPPQNAAYNNRSLRVDHDHETGAIRGLLCHGCNCAIGHARENPQVLREAASYLERVVT